MLGPLPGVGLVGPLPAAEAAGGIAAGTTGGAASGAVAATGVGVILIVCVAAGFTLWKFGQFQQTLIERGLIILDDPLAVCIQGCHYGNSVPLAKVFELEFRG